MIVAAGPLGTNKLLQRCRLGGALPRISSRLGELVRTNSESILAVTVPEDYPDDLTKRVAITSSIYPDPHTHIETVTYGKAGNSMSMLYTLMVGDGTRADAAAEAARRRSSATPAASPRSSSRATGRSRTIIVLVMQTLDNAIALRPTLKRSGDVACRPSRTRRNRTRPSSRSPTRPPSGWPSGPAGSPRARPPRR